MSFSVIIADDEPLVLAGLESMIDWEREGFEIRGAARNGRELEELIKAEKPELVITDIKMPIKSGLEVMSDLRAEDFPLPQFILLTSFEEFSYVKEALSLGAVDYLVKLELTEDALLSSLRKAAVRIRGKEGRDDGHIRIPGRQLLQEQFFIRQFFHVSDEETPLCEQISTLGLDLDYPLLLVAVLSFPSLAEEEDKEKAMSLYNGAVRISQETVSRYLHCYTAALDPSSAAIILCFRPEQVKGYRSFALSALTTAREAVKDYLSLPSYAAAGVKIEDVRLLSESFSSAKAIMRSLSENSPILFADYEEYRNIRNVEEREFHLDREKLKKAFSEVNAMALKEGIHEAAEELRRECSSRLGAIDIASDILYMVMNLLPDGQEIPARVFTSPSSYRILYQLGTASEVATWLDELADGTAAILTERRQDYRAGTVNRICTYINDNVSRRLTLGEVASIFGYSQGYLSSLFPKYAGSSFVDYVTNAKIRRAKEIMASGESRIYEVARQTGFESAFYFSKVFKKVTGITPSEYIASLQSRDKTENKEQV